MIRKVCVFRTEKNAFYANWIGFTNYKSVWTGKKSVFCSPDPETTIIFHLKHCDLQFILRRNSIWQYTKPYWNVTWVLVVPENMTLSIECAENWWGKCQDRKQKAKMSVKISRIFTSHQSRKNLLSVCVRLPRFSGEADFHCQASWSYQNSGHVSYRVAIAFCWKFHQMFHSWHPRFSLPRSPALPKLKL